MTLTEALPIIIVPIALALLPLIWGLSGWWIRRLQFQELIFRELEEIGPYPVTKEEADGRKHWSEHHNNKKLLHKEILDKPTENRDFILSLSSDVVYYVNQLWRFHDNAEQWLHMLSMLETKIPFWQGHRRKRLAKVKAAWYVLMREYGVKFKPAFYSKFSDLSEEQTKHVIHLSEKQQERLNVIDGK